MSKGEMEQTMSSVGTKIVSRLKRFAESLERGEDITERFTVRTIKLNLEPKPYSPELVRSARNKLRSSQAIFAQFIGVSVKTVQDWEQGLELPSGAACRLMDEIRRNPKYFLRRLTESAVPAGASDE